MTQKYRPRDIDERLIREIVSRILRIAKPKQIILFGSAAMSPMTADSDLDLLVIDQGFTDQRDEAIRL